MVIGHQSPKKWFLFLATVTLTTTLVMLIYKPTERISIQRKFDEDDYFNYDVGPQNWRNLSKNQILQLSNLGKIIYLGESPPAATTNKTYKILTWKYGKTIENRHLKQYGNGFVDPFIGCSVNNCEITYKDQDLEDADMVIFHLQRMQKNDLPKRQNTKQIWAFLTDESPFHTFGTVNKLKNYNGVFNWSMTYRMDSDIPVPYGRAIHRKHPVQPKQVTNRKRDVLVAILGSNCGGRNNRWPYVAELQKYIKIDVYGGCGPLKTCPGHFKADCDDIDRYMFYLAFENSNCDQYITEKLWWNAYKKNSIPVVMGSSKSTYQQLLPPNSYLNIEEFAHPKDLAQYILYLNSTNKFLEYYQWQENYQVFNEHGYFQSKSVHYCRACEAINYNERKQKVYNDLEQFWSSAKDCHPAWNA